MTQSHRNPVFFRRAHACLVCTPSWPRQREPCQQCLSKFPVERERDCSPGSGLCLPLSHSPGAALSTGLGSWRLSGHSCATTGTDKELSQQELSKTRQQRSGQSGKGERPREQNSLTRAPSANHQGHPLFFCHDLLKFLC